MRDFNWKDLYNKRLAPPFIPPKEDNYDSKIHLQPFKDDYSQKSLTNAIELLDNKVNSLDEIQSVFKDYYYDFREHDDYKISHMSSFKDYKEIKTGTKPNTSAV